MLLTRVDFSKFTVDVGKFKKDLNKAVADSMVEGGKDFLKAAVAKVPVLSGESQTSFMPLSRLVQSSVQLPSVPRRAKPRSGDSQGFAEIAEIPGKMTLTIKTSVIQFLVNEFTGGHAPSAPWKSFAAGSAAFLRTFKRLMPEKLAEIKLKVNRA